MTLVILPQSLQCRLKAVFSAVCQVSPPTSPVHLYRSPGSSHTLSRQEELAPGKDQRKAACAHVHQTSQCILFKRRRSKSILVDMNYERYILSRLNCNPNIRTLYLSAAAKVSSTNVWQTPMLCQRAANMKI